MTTLKSKMKAKWKRMVESNIKESDTKPLNDVNVEDVAEEEIVPETPQKRNCRQDTQKVSSDAARVTNGNNKDFKMSGTTIGLRRDEYERLRLARIAVEKTTENPVVLHEFVFDNFEKGFKRTYPDAYKLYCSLINIFNDTNNDKAE